MTIRDIKKMTIEELGLPVRIHNCLENADINNIFDLICKHPSDVQYLRNMRKRMFEDLQTTLKEKLHLSVDVVKDEWMLPGDDNLIKRARRLKLKEKQSESKKQLAETSLINLYGGHTLLKSYELIEILENINISALFDKDALEAIHTLDPDYPDYSIEEIVDQLNSYPSYAHRHLVAPVIKGVGGIAKFNEILSLIDLKYVVGKKDFFITSSIYPTDKEKVLEGLLDFGLVSELEEISIDMLVYLNVNRSDVLKIKKSLGWKNMTDFYLMRRDKVSKKIGDDELITLLKMVEEIKRKLSADRSLNTGVRLTTRKSWDTLELDRYKWW